MIQVIPIKHDISDRGSRLRSHILSPRLGVTVTLTIEGKKENIISILEDHLLETISSVEWSSPDSDKDFTFLTESYNRFIRNLEPQDLSQISVVISLLKDNILTISAIGNATAYLVEADDITQIVAPDRSRFDFHTLTAGEVGRNASIYISNADSLSLLGNDFLMEFSEMSSQEFSETAKNIFSREVEIPVHLIRVAHSFKAPVVQKRQRGRGQFDLLKEKSKEAAMKLKDLPVVQNMREKIDSVDFGANEKQKYGFIGAGIIVIFLLLYVLFNAVSGAFSGSGFASDEYAQKVKQAQTLVSESANLKANPDAFASNMQQAEALLAELRTAQKYLPDVQKIQGDIDAYKKEVYGIETIDLSEKTSLVPFGETGFVPINVFEIANKLLIIGKTGIIADYVRDTPLPQIIAYPNQEVAVDSVINDSGVPYVVSENTKLITLRQGATSFVNVTGQDWWELGSQLKSYNGNLYSVNVEQNQIYRYKPSVNGFSQKVNVLPVLTTSKILDIAVDGGFYVLTTDGKISRSVGGSELKSLTLNKIPGVWNIDANASTQMIANNLLSYVYIRNGKNLWIFQPNSRQFQDINALTYIAQVQIQSEKEITDISVPRDGQMYITTENGIFEAQFQISDGKLFLK